MEPRAPRPTAGALPGREPGLTGGAASPRPEAALRVRFAGSGDAFGSGGRFQACIHLETAGTGALLDCGASSLVALRRLGLDPQAVDVVLVSHLHGDHFGGLPFLILDAQFRRRTRPLLVAGPPGLETRTRQAMEVLFPGSSTAGRRFPLDFRELPPGRPATVGPLHVTPFAVAHPSGAPAYALRIEAGPAVLAYSGDTAWTDTLLEAARGADLLIVEAYSLDRRIPHHLDYATVRAQRGRLDCRRVVLTHAGPELLARLDEVDRTWAEPAHDGLALEVRPPGAAEPTGGLP